MWHFTFSNWTDIAGAATPGLETQNGMVVRGRFGETGNRGNLKYHTSRSDQILEESVDQPRVEGRSSVELAQAQQWKPLLSVRRCRYCELESEEKVVEWST